MGVCVMVPPENNTNIFFEVARWKWLEAEEPPILGYSYCPYIRIHRSIDLNLDSRSQKFAGSLLSHRIHAVDAMTSV